MIANNNFLWDDNNVDACAEIFSKFYFLNVRRGYSHFSFAEPNLYLANINIVNFPPIITKCDANFYFIFVANILYSLLALIHFFQSIV